jgi:regulator of nucleoside diphosphate kinase
MGPLIQLSRVVKRRTIMDKHAAGPRPPIHLLAAESDLVGNLALQAEHHQPVVAAMLLEEIERAAELHDQETMPSGHAILNSRVTYLDEKNGQAREVELVMPAEANITEGRVSILTPMGAALYGLAEGHSIDWPDLHGNLRRIRIIRVLMPKNEASDAARASASP